MPEGALKRAAVPRPSRLPIPPSGPVKWLTTRSWLAPKPLVTPTNRTVRKINTLERKYNTQNKLKPPLVMDLHKPHFTVARAQPKAVPLPPFQGLHSTHRENP